MRVLELLDLRGGFFQMRTVHVANRDGLDATHLVGGLQVH